MRTPVYKGVCQAARWPRARVRCAPCSGNTMLLLHMRMHAAEYPRLSPRPHRLSPEGDACIMSSLSIASVCVRHLRHHGCRDAIVQAHAKGITDEQRPASSVSTKS